MGRIKEKFINSQARKHFWHRMKLFQDRFEWFLVLTYGITILSLLVAAALVPKGEDVLFINGHHTNFQDQFFSLFTYLGDGIIFIPLLLFLGFLRFEYVATSLTAWILIGILSAFFKRMIFSDQLRPQALIDNNLLYFVPGVEVHRLFSFPSGHTLTIFCATFLLSIVLRSRALAVLLLLVALLVGYSRIYLLQHFLMDVAAGAVIGTGSAYAVWLLVSRMKKPEWMSRKIRLF